MYIPTDMSPCSTSSMMSVSFCGQEMDADRATDEVFKQLQDTFNDSHLALRGLLMSADRGETFIEAAEIHYSLDEYCDGFVGLIKELKSVSKQLLGKPEKEERDSYAKWKAMKKLEKDAKNMAAAEDKLRNLELDKKK